CARKVYSNYEAWFAYW
nr:immunoglobulin heavy chain junction region [Mus musculus]